MSKTASLHLAYMDTCGPIPTLLIHGFMLSKTIWGPQYDDLYDMTRIIAPDLPGHGHSDTVKVITVASMAQQCRQLLKTLDINTPIVVGGLSMGGFVALEFYRQFKEQVAGLMLISTRATADSAAAQAKRNQHIALVKKQGVSALTDELLPLLLAPESYKTMPELSEALRQISDSTSAAGTIGSLQAMRERPAALPWLDQIDIPTLIIHGQQDQLIPLAEAEEMYDKIRTAELYAIPAAGHMPNLEQAELFNDLVAEFLEGL